MARAKPRVGETWKIMLKAPRWSAPLPSARTFETPEAAAFYAHTLVDDPEMWTETESAALCLLLEAEDPADVQVRVMQVV